MIFRKARTGDVGAIHKLLTHFAQQGKLLARSLSELYSHLRDFFVAVDEETDQIIGCCSMHIVWENLAEVRSLAVQDSHQGSGIGRRLVEACFVEARDLDIGRIFTLTYEVDFFQHIGFQLVDKNVFPQKIWADCLHCPKFPECDEVALVKDVQ
jgi:amino-acid N-acetyltransferase